MLNAYCYINQNILLILLRLRYREKLNTLKREKAFSLVVKQWHLYVFVVLKKQIKYANDRIMLEKREFLWNSVLSFDMYHLNKLVHCYKSREHSYRNCLAIYMSQEKTSKPIHFCWRWQQFDDKLQWGLFSLHISLFKKEFFF